jgi:NitT/TauT family transport system permease protein
MSQSILIGQVAWGDGGRGREPRAARLRRFARARLNLVAQLALVVAFFGVWEAVAGDPAKGALVDEFFVGRPSLILSAIGVWWADGTIARNASLTIQEALIGFAIGTIAGIVIGFCLGVTRVGRTVLAPLVFSTYALPRIGFAPLFILWFGLGVGSKIALVVVLVFFLTFFNTYQGVQEVDEQLVAVCRIMKASRWQILSKVVLPSSMAWIAVGLKVAVPYAFIGAVVGEILAGDLGLGALIARAVNTFDPNRLMAAVLLTTLLAIVLNAAVGRATGYLLHWQHAHTVS